MEPHGCEDGWGLRASEGSGVLKYSVENSSERVQHCVSMSTFQRPGTGRQNGTHSWAGLQEETRGQCQATGYQRCFVRGVRVIDGDTNRIELGSLLLLDMLPDDKIEAAADTASDDKAG